MKYLVMECHTGFAVLMDEESRFHKAANMHYEVGQTVTNPVLLTDDRGITVKKNVIMKIAAAAACLVMVSGVGIRYYLNHRTAESVVMVIDETQYEMQLNRSGEVIRVLSSSGGQTVEETFASKPKTAADTVNALLKIQKNAKELSDGDTVEIIIEAENDSTLEACKSDLRSEAEKLHLKADVQERGHAKTKRTEETAETTTAAETTDTKQHTAKTTTVTVTEQAAKITVTAPTAETHTEPTRPTPPAEHTVPHPELTAPAQTRPEPGNPPKETLPAHTEPTKPEHGMRPGIGTTVTAATRPEITEPMKPETMPTLPEPGNGRKPDDPKENGHMPDENIPAPPAENPPAEQPKENQWRRYQSPLTPQLPEVSVPTEPEKPEKSAHLPVREDGERILPEKPAEMMRTNAPKLPETVKPEDDIKPDLPEEPVRSQENMKQDLQEEPVKPEHPEILHMHTEIKP